MGSVRLFVEATEGERHYSTYGLTRHAWMNGGGGGQEENERREGDATRRRRRTALRDGLPFGVEGDDASLAERKRRFRFDVRLHVVEAEALEAAHVR